MADKFMEQTGIEIGYFSKRKDQFNNEISKGFNSVGVQPKVASKKKSPKQSSTIKASPKKDIANTPPNQLTGQDFVDRMRLAKEAKAKSA